MREPDVCCKEDPPKRVQRADIFIDQKCANGGKNLLLP